MEGNTTQMILFIRNVVLALLFIKKIKKKIKKVTEVIKMLVFLKSKNK